VDPGVRVEPNRLRIERVVELRVADERLVALSDRPGGREQLPVGPSGVDPLPSVGHRLRLDESVSLVDLKGCLRNGEVPPRPSPSADIAPAVLACL
jgi:hypothetical protein